MKLKIARTLAPLACVALVACHIPGMKDNKAPSGQVVATVDGEEITLSELKAELAGAPKPPNAEAAKAIQEAALRNIIIRKIAAKAAHDQGLDKTPEFAIEKQRVNQNLLTQALQKQLAASVAAPTRQDAEAFIGSHPGMFAERKLVTVDQIRMAAPKTQDELKEFLPLHSLSEFEALLAKKGADYQRSASIIDSGSTDPGMMSQIDKLPPGEPFMVPSNGMVLVNQIRETRPAAFTGDAAVKFAMGALRSQRIQEGVAKGVENLVKGKASLIKYNDAYKPVHPLGVTTPPAPAAPAKP